MLQILFQVWGGLFYLLNKIFFSRAERATNHNQRLWLIWSWVVYLIGLPAWVIIFIIERNWMAAAVEAGGATGMMLGLIIAIKGNGQEPKWLDYIARIVAVLGIGYSLYDFGGITTFNQILEFGIVVGFLLGTYCLAKQKLSGYLWLILMNASNAWLMGIEHYPWLLLQQIISLGFVIDAYWVKRKNLQK